MRNIAKRIGHWVLLCLCWSSTDAIGQTISAVRPIPLDEQPSPLVYGVVQDSHGYIWMGTGSGLFRYNGSSGFKKYSTPGFKDSEVYGLVSDWGGCLWFRDADGQVGLVKDDSLRALGTGPLEEGKVEHFVVDNSNRCVYFYGEREVHSYDPATGKYIQLFHCKDCPPGHLVRSVIPSGKEFFVAPDNSDILCTSESVRVNILPRSLGPVSFLNTSSVMQHLWLYDEHDKTLTTIKQPDMCLMDLEPDFGEVLSISEDGLGNTWIDTEDGAWCLGPDLRPYGSMNPLLAGHRVNHVKADREGGLWFGTSGDGVFYVPSMTTRELISERVSFIKKGHEGRLLVGTRSGYLYIFGQDGTTTTVHFEGMRSVLDLGGTLVVSLISSPSQILYDMTTGNRAEALIGLVSGTVSPTETVFFSSWDKVYKIPLPDLKGYLKTELSGLYKNRVSLKEKAGAIDTIRAKVIWADRFQDRVWMGGNGDIRFYDISEDTVYTVPNTHSIGLSFAQTDDSTVWAGTNRGLFGIRDGTVIERYTIGTGLVSNHCSDLLIDKESKIWIGTDKGLMSLDIRTESFKTFGPPNGIKGLSINGLSSQGPEIWVGTSSGLFTVGESGFSTNDTPPLIFLSRAQIGQRDTVLSNTYFVPPDKNDITLCFEGLSYKSLGHFKFKHRMLGLDSSWVVSPGKSNCLVFPRLAPGKYCLEAKAVNEDGIESVQPVKVKVTVWPYPWQIWWVQAMLVIGGFLLSAHVTVVWQKRRLHFMELNHQVGELKTEALRSQMNPHFIFNALNGIQLMLYKKDRKESMKQLSLFSDMMRSMFRHSQKTEIPLREEILFLRKYLELEKLRFGDRVQISLKVEGQLVDSQIMLPPLLLQPLVENAFKHGLMHKEGTGELKVCFFMRGDVVKAVIRDNGIGRTESMFMNQQRDTVPRKSSTHNILERIRLTNLRWQKEKRYLNLKTIDLYDGNRPTGTQVELTVKP